MIKMLYVDDDASMVEVIKFVSDAHSGLVMETADSLSEAVSKMESSRYDVVMTCNRPSRIVPMQIMENVKKLQSWAMFIVFSESSIDIGDDKELEGTEVVLYQPGNIRVILDDLMNGLEEVIAAQRLGHLRDSVPMDIFESLPDAVLVLDPSLIVHMANGEARRMFGDSIVRSKSFTDLVHQDEIGATLDSIKNQPSSGRREGVDTLIIGADKKPEWMEIKASRTTIGLQDGYTILTLRRCGERRKELLAAEEGMRKLDLLMGLSRHDLMNELTALDGYLKVLKAEEQDSYKSRFAQKAMDITTAMREKLVLIKHYQNLGTLPPQWVNVGDAIDYACTSLELGKVELDHDLGGMEIISDPMLERAFNYMIAGCLRQGSRVNRIRFSQRMEGRSAIITLEDDGPGIMERDKRSIFDYGRKGPAYGMHYVNEMLRISRISIKETGCPGMGIRYEIYVPPGAFRFNSSNTPNMTSVSSMPRTARTSDQG